QQPEDVAARKALRAKPGREPGPGREPDARDAPARRVIDRAALGLRFDPLAAGADPFEEAVRGAVAGEQHVRAVFVGKPRCRTDRAAAAADLRRRLVDDG